MVVAAKRAAVVMAGSGARPKQESTAEGDMVGGNGGHVESEGRKIAIRENPRHHHLEQSREREAKQIRIQTTEQRTF